MRRLSSSPSFRLLVIILGLGLSLCAWLVVAQPRPRSPKILVRGYIATSSSPKRSDVLVAMASSKSDDVFLPGVKVYLMDLLSNTAGTATRTDLSGRFTLAADPERRVKVCWSAAGFVSGCSAETFATLKYLHVGTLRIAPKKTPNMTSVYGKVRFADGKTPRLLQPLAGINSFAMVTLLNKNGARMARSYVNNFGQYFLPQVPVKATITIQAQVDGGIGKQLILPKANLAGAAIHPIDVTIDNSSPRIEPLVPLDGAGVRVKVGRPGTSVRLQATASDPDGDALTYQWLVADGSGSLSATNTPSVNWTLPNHDGLYVVNLIVSDGKGGYAQTSVNLRADTAGIPFNGYVRGTDVNAVADAEVSVNGQTAFTGAEGFFQIRVRDANRFVFNINKKGYGLVSKIYDGPVTGGEWFMTKATVTSIDPTRDNEVINRRSGRECPGPGMARLNWREYEAVAQPIWQDGKGNAIPTPRDGKLEVPLPTYWKPKQDCGSGIRVTIPANSLQDSAGNPPAGNVDVSLSTVDLSTPWQMPGDYTVLDPGGDTRVMQSYGAGMVEITSGTTRYNLKPGASAKVVIPVDPMQLAAGGPLPPTIPILFYDERKGVWVEEGSATLNGNQYEATVKHFSEINTDTIKTNQSCVRVLSPTLPTTYNVEITIPMGGGAAPKVLNRLIDNGPTQTHVIYNLPSNVNIVIVPIRIADNTPIGTFVVNTGAPQVPSKPNLPVAPYTACATTVTLSDQVVPEEPASGEFLHGLYSFEATNLFELNASNPTLAGQLDAATAQYYLSIDPRGKRLNLNGFKSTNGFGGVSELHAIYANSGDLGFGRDMHCNKQLASDGQFDVACYVSNYGTIATSDTADVADAVAGGTSVTPNPIATVAMEYSRIESANGVVPEFDDPVRVVKFYVYKGDGTGLLKSADLDSGGIGNPRPRPIPQLCMVCHNGEYPNGPVIGAAPPFGTRDDVKLNSRFLPFDLHYYTFAPAPWDKATQQPVFKQMNQDIVAIAPPTATAIGDVITNMYPGATQVENFVVAGWNSQPIHQGMYREVLARACRTCHAAQVFDPLTFVQSSQFIDRLGSIESRVCVQHVMPHAKRTHQIFWTSVGPHMPAQLQVYGDTFGTGLNGWNGQLCGAFTPAGPPPSFYDLVIQKIFNGVGTGTTPCISCHNGGSPPASLSLAAPGSYANIVNTNSTEVPAVKRIAPNDTAHSYLWLKIQGTQGTVGGFGSQMPQGCPGGVPCLTAPDITSITTWINNGAPH